MKLEEAKGLPLIKFNYEKPNHCKTPLVKVLDYDYKGQLQQKSYGERKDILGFNIKKDKDRKKHSKELDDLYAFSEYSGFNKKELYNRIKEFDPDIIKFIRRYNKSKIKKPKIKGTIFWRGLNLK